MELGQVVKSMAGRDSGRYYAVVAVIDENTVKIADGSQRHIMNAKIKNVKHLKTNGDILERIAEKLRANTQVFDAELFSALRPYNEEN